MDGNDARSDESSLPSVVGDRNLTIFFSQLRILCTDVMGLLQNPKGTSGESLVALSEFICRSSPEHLQSSFHYILLPLLLLVDGAVKCRAERNTREKKHSIPRNTPNIISDNVAESLLRCMEQLLKRCHLGSVDQMVMLLKKLAAGCMLSACDASEEFRGGMVLCVKALFLRLSPCSVASCSCKLAPGLSFFAKKSSLGMPVVDLAHRPSECLISFLQSQDASAMVGHWISLLLQSAETEVSRGHQGSTQLRTEAYLTLRILIAKVGTADSMAFFLPGIVSRFGKALHISKTMISGAAGSMESLEHVIHGLTEFLVIVFGDEQNLHGLGIDSGEVMGSHIKRDWSSQSVLDALRQLPPTYESVNVLSVTDHTSANILTTTVPSKAEFQAKNVDGSLFVERTKDWIDRTREHVDKLLSATFPHLCANSATKVRLALVDAVFQLLSKCIFTLKGSKLMLLECLYILACDDYTVVASAAHECLEILMFDEKYVKEEDIADTFDRLVSHLPTAVLGSEDIIAVSCAQRLLASIYYAGPHHVIDHVLFSQVTTARFLDSLSLSLSHNSVFSGSFGKFVLAEPSAVGYLPSLGELNNVLHLSATSAIENVGSVTSYIRSHNTLSHNRVEIVQSDYEFPRAPPWFANVGGQKLYKAVSGILRLIGLSLVTDYGSGLSLSSVIDILLEHIRKLIVELREKDYRKESWYSWYVRIGSGRLLREASTAVCVINEILFGLSDQSLYLCINMFETYGGNKVRNHCTSEAESAGGAFASESMPAGCVQYHPQRWIFAKRSDAINSAIDCVGSVLHEYLSHEIWNLPVDSNSLMQDVDVENLTLHFFQDTSMLQQVIIDGLGIFSISLGKDFERSGFLQDCLYLLLENLICSNSQTKRTSDAVLRKLSASLGHETVRHLVVANADRIIDSLCRYLRHLDINPQVPNVLAAVLSYIGVAHDILPLLDEPMRSVSSELEVLGRHQHPELTVSFLKAMRVIVQASRCEALTVADKILQHSALIKTKKEQGEVQEKHTDTGMLPDKINSENISGCWGDVLYKLNELGRYRSTVGSVARSCLTAAGPLLASVEEPTCLIALDIVEDGIAALEMVEKAYKHQKKMQEEIKEVVELLLLHDLQDTLDTSNEAVDENILLPAVNKIWPYMVACFKHGNPVAVKRCLKAMCNLANVCGGEFFIRRFHTNGFILWKLLTTGKTNPGKPSRVGGPLLLPYRKIPSSEESVAEVSQLKVQVSVLNMIADIARDKKSASALGAVFRKVSSLIVGIACCGPDALQTAALNALSSLSLIDPDFIWVLLADIVYSLGKCIPSPPSSDFPDIHHMLPPPSSKTDYLFVLYGGEFHSEPQLPKAEKVYRKLVSEVFPFQSMYI